MHGYGTRTEFLALRDWLRDGGRPARGLAALPPEKVEQAREMNRRLAERLHNRRRLS
jgi:hypothetical protein